MRVIDAFLKEFSNESSCLSPAIHSKSAFPVYIFNPSNLIASTTSHALILQHYLKTSLNRAVILDCAEIESKTEFFSEIFKGIIGNVAQLTISYDFSAFINAFNVIKPTQDIVLIVNNSSQINLSHLDDFVRLWERKSKDFSAIPQLKFVFDDPVAFLGMEARLRDRFRVQEHKVPRVMQVFDELIVDMIQTGFPVVLHPNLMARFDELAVSESISFNSIINQLKFLIISHYNADTLISFTLPSSMTQSFLFVTELSAKLKAQRPSAPVLSPSNDFYSVCFNGILLESQAYAELQNEMKSLAPNDFVGLFTSLKSAESADKSNDSLIETIKRDIISTMKAKESKSVTKKSELKDSQLDLIKSLSDHLKSVQSCEISSELIVKDERGNVRRAFEADPQASLEVSLKFPSFYLNCNSACCSSEGDNKPVLAFKSLDIQNKLSYFCHNRPSMPDICLLYRLSLEFPSKSINLLSWHNSFLSVIGEKKATPLITARFFKSLNELQLIGMVSEFGRSRRKRRFVDRFNITDTLNYEQ